MTQYIDDVARFTGYGDTAQEAIFNPDIFGDRAAAAAHQEAQADAAFESRRFFQDQSALGARDIKKYGERAVDEMSRHRRAARSDLLAGMGLSEDALGQGRASALAQMMGAREDISGGFGQARGDVAGGFDAARASLGGLSGLGRYGEQAAQRGGVYDIASQADGRLGQRLDQGLYSGIENDPGYQARLREGEQAIMRTAAAKGGRMGGETLKALMEHGQEFASREYDKAAQRRLAEAGFESSADQTRLGALQSQASREDAATQAALSRQMQLGQIGYGATGQMAALAAQRGQVLGGLAQQQGSALGNIGMQGAGLESAYGQNMAGLYSGTYGQMAGDYMSSGQQLASILSGMGTNLGNVAIGVGSQGASSLAGEGAYGGMGEQASANNKREIFGGILSAFSDARLKDSLQPCDDPLYDALGLQCYTWEWNDDAMMFGLTGPARGVIAQEVAEDYPDAVGELDGYLVVNYTLLAAMAKESL